MSLRPAACSLMSVTPSSFLSTAIEAAQAAADVILHYYEKNVEVQIKKDQTPVTVADVESEQVIREIIATQFPDHGIFGEEAGRTESTSDYLWLIDPIDGTKSFISSNPFFSTQIALMQGTDIILGVSNAPAFGELACAEKGQGAWLNDRPCRVSDISELENCAISTGNLRSLASGDRWGKLGEIISRVNRIRGYGDFYQYHLLATARIDAVIESDVDILDIAAASLIVSEAGGTFTDLEGAGVDLETCSVLAANSELHDVLLAAL